MSATQPTETLALALGNAYKMLSADRGFTPHPDVRAVFERWERMRMLPLNTPTFARVCDLVYVNGLMQRGTGGGSEQALQTARVHFRANRHKPAWLADRMRNLWFLETDERPLAHAGIGYSLVLLVVTPAKGQVAIDRMKRARTEMEAAVAALRKQGKPVRQGRVLRLVLNVGTPAPARVPVVKMDGELVSIETWYASELLADPTLVANAPRHTPLTSLTADELARIPASTLNAPIGDSILTTDAIARWFSYEVGQAICIERRQLFEGGASYTFRRVVPP
jgi:hypothetical protein